MVNTQSTSINAYVLRLAKWLRAEYQLAYHHIENDTVSTETH